MPDDDTPPTIDALLDLEPGTDRVAETTATATPLSIEEFLAAYDAAPPGGHDDADVGDRDDDGELELAPDPVDDALVDDPHTDSVGDDVGSADLDADELLELVEQAAAELAELAATTGLTAPIDAAETNPVDERSASAAPPPAPDPASVTVDGPTFTSSTFGVETPTGLVLQYPSRDFPPPPVVRLQVPTGWVGAAVADRELAARAPDPIDGIAPSVDVQIRRVAAAEGAVAALGACVPAADDTGATEVIADELRDDPAAPARRVLTRRRTPDGIVVRARQLFVYVPAGEHLASVVTVTATWPESADAELGSRLTDVVSSVRLFTPQRSH